MIDIVLDNRLRIPLDGLSSDVITELKLEFTHRNPDYYKATSRGFYANHIPRHIETWREAGGCLSLPRGAWKRVRTILVSKGIRYHVTDRRTLGKAISPPAHLITLYDYQERCVSTALSKENCLIKSPTGCLVGDTEVIINRARIGRRMPLSHVVRMFNGGKARVKGGSYSGRKWRIDIPTMIRAPQLDGTVRLSKIISASNSGIQKVFRLKTEESHVICATADHRVLTPSGWIELQNLSVGDFILVDDIRPKKSSAKKSKPWYKLFRIPEHPFVSRKGVNPKKGGFTVPLHRLIAEARENNLSFKEFILAIKAGVPNLIFLDPKVWVVHHIDCNSLNNSLNNLKVVTHAEHKQIHCESNYKNISIKLRQVKVCSIEYAGARETFDLEVEDVSAFIADGIAVHNSGKSTMCLAFASRVNVPTLIVVNTSRLFDQWVKRVQSEMDFEAGVIQGKKFDLKAVTIAMQQSIWRMTDDKWNRVNAFFGAVVYDECDMAAAATFIKAIDRFTCKYRIGVSADHTRKDGKHFLLHDMFGQVAAEVTKEELIERKFVLDVEVDMVTTSFEAQWYRNQQTAYRMRMAGESQKSIHEELLKYNPEMKLEDVPKGNPDYNQLIDEMIVDEGRNLKILSKAQELVLAGKKTVILCERVSHCHYLADQLRMLGISCGLLIGEEENAEDFQACINGLTSGLVDVGVGTRHAFGRGIDLPLLDDGIIATVVHTNKQLFGQIRGRMCRTAPGKTQARLWYLYDKNVFGNTPVKNLSSWNRVCRVDGVDSKEWMK